MSVRNVCLYWFRELPKSPVYHAVFKNLPSFSPVFKHSWSKKVPAVKSFFRPSNIKRCFPFGNFVFSMMHEKVGKMREKFLTIKQCYAKRTNLSK